MRFSIFIVTVLFAVSLCRTGASAQDGLLTPLPDSVQYSCVSEYGKTADAYWPVIGDILRFNAMFENYATLCAAQAPAEMKAIQPFVTTMRTRAKSDVDDSYDVIDRLIHTSLRNKVPPKCQHDRAAQDQAVKQFQAGMDDQSRKAKNRLNRSAHDMKGAAGADICRNLTAIKDDAEKHIGGKDLSNPLFEIAFLRGMVVPSDSGQRAIYFSYRNVLKQVQADRAKVFGPAKKP